MQKGLSEDEQSCFRKKNLDSRALIAGKLIFHGFQCTVPLL